MSLFTLPLRPTGAPSRPTVRARLRAAGITIRVTPDGQYRVNFLGGCESTAFYTLDLDDALITGLAMAAEQKAAAAQTTEGASCEAGAPQECRTLTTKKAK